MNTNNLEKCDVYPQGLFWFKCYTFIYIYALIVVKLAMLLHAATNEDYWEGLRLMFTGLGLTVPAIDFIVTALLIGIAIVNAVYLPMVGIGAYRSTLALTLSLLAYRPVMLLLQLIFINKINSDDFKVALIIYPITVLFSVFNLVYFSKRKDLFANDLTVLVMDKVKDLTKH